MSIMIMVKYTTLLAIATEGAAFFFGAAQWWLPADLLPMWLRRVIYLSMSLPPVYNPWFSLLVLGPFRREIKKRYGILFRSTQQHSLQHTIRPNSTQQPSARDQLSQF